ncbi:MAG: PKD domain-containing protein [Gemmatimonadales bacterium]
MTARTIIRMLPLGFALAAACSSPTPPSPPAPPPPPPPPGAPVVSAVTGGTLPVGTTFELSATFNDTSVNASPWSFDVNWGDGNSSSGSKDAIAPIAQSHTYATEGNYTVTVSVTNHHAATGTKTASVAATSPVIIAAGDIGDCDRTSDNATGDLIATLQGIVMPLGDNAYLSGTATEFANCYDPAWGRQKARTRPVAGNHDYYNTGATKNADGYFGYFGASAGDPSKGYYSFNLGSWLVIVLNTGTESADFIAAGSAQEQWLRALLSSHTEQCTVAMMHHPQFSTVTDRPFVRTETTPLWQALYDGGADLVLNGHDHTYQRYKPMRPDGTADASFGIRQITVGTGGGEGLYGFGSTNPNLEVRAGNGENGTYGVLKLTLKNGSYSWQFMPAAGQGSFTDSGSANCHGRP